MHEDLVNADIARVYLRDIRPLWKAFWFHMHLMAQNLEEFADGLTQITDEVFTYHVSGQKNDLAKWVQEVVGDAVLAQWLTGVTTKEEAATAAARRVASLRAVLPKNS
jgi:pentose-5-phosphate-3-epimerase